MNTITKYDSFENLKNSSKVDFNKDILEPKFYIEYKEFIELLRVGNTIKSKKKKVNKQNAK